MQNISKQRATSTAPLGGTQRVKGVPVPVNMSSVRGTESRAGINFKTTSGAFTVSGMNIPARG